MQRPSDYQLFKEFVKRSETHRPITPEVEELLRKMEEEEKRERVLAWGRAA